MTKIWTFFKRWFIEMGSPPLFYRWSSKALVWLGLSSIIVLSLGLFMGIGLSPADYKQGDVYRIIYIHVPSAIMGESIFIFMAMCGFINIIWRAKISGMLLKAAAPIGMSFVLLVLTTGSIWGKPTWGTWWVWGDARLNLTAILLLVYLGYIASRQFNKDLGKTAKNSSLIGIFGVVQIPILHFSVIWWRSVHQQASILSQETVASGDAPMSSDILITLLLSVLLVTLVHTFLTKRFRISNDILWDNYLNPKSRAKI